ncbi:hypothetical protein C8R44DRAFT_755345 [Mycena epipterygia]|nr:hypothetical protein C8R44DRAFT_755345 [Mycena epipterygia]
MRVEDAGALKISGMHSDRRSTTEPATKGGGDEETGRGGTGTQQRGTVKHRERDVKVKQAHTYLNVNQRACAPQTPARIRLKCLAGVVKLSCGWASQQHRAGRGRRHAGRGGWLEGKKREDGLQAQKNATQDTSQRSASGAQWAQYQHRCGRARDEDISVGGRPWRLDEEDAADRM